MIRRPRLIAEESAKAEATGKSARAIPAGTVHPHPKQGIPMRYPALLIRIMLAFLLVVLPIFCIGIFMYRTGVQTIHDQVVHQHAQQLRFVVSDLAEQLERIQYEIALMKRESSYTRMTSMPEAMTPYESTYTLNMMQSRLTAISISANCVRQIHMVLPETLHQISSSEESIHVPVIKRIKDADLRKAEEIADATLLKISRIDGALLYADQLPYPLQMLPGELPRMIFFVQFDDEAIEKNLLDISTSRDTLYVLARKNGEILSTNIDDSQIVTLLAEKTDLRDGYGFSCRQIPHFAVRQEDTLLDIVCIAAIPEYAVTNSLGTLQYSIWLLSLLMIVALLLYGVYSYRQIHRPVVSLLDGYARLESGDMEFQVPPASSNEIRLLTERFNEMIGRLRDTMTQLTRQRQLTEQAKFKQLQSQINPHFLYNCFYILNNMIALGDEENALLISQRLGQYFHYVTRDERMIVPLREEVIHARNYMEIQRIRFGQRLSLLFECPPQDWDEVPVPRLILQPILENAFKHALEDAESGLMHVRFQEEKGALKIKIENDGPIDDATIASMARGLEDGDQAGETTGLVNVHRRLRIAHNTGIEIHKSNPSGLMLIITLHKEAAVHGKAHSDRG